VLRRADGIGPTGLRTLDAMQVATALGLGDDCGILIAYDERVLEAARLEGLRVARPGRG
jgi:predicted nucleic acid-binding protein